MTSPYRITYSAPGTGDDRVLPFVIGVIADVAASGRRAGADKTIGRFVDIDHKRFDAVLASFGPRLDLRLPAVSDTAGEMVVSLAFTCLDDFTAERVARQVPGLAAALTDSLLAAIVGHPDFVHLEHTWRGLHHLVTVALTNPLLRIRVLDCSKGGLDHDLRRADAIEATHLFRVLYDEPYGREDGEPFGLLVVNYEITDQVSDISLVERLASIAATCFTPTLLPAAQALTAMLDASEHVSARSGADHPALARWQVLRDSYEARNVALTCDVAADSASAAVPPVGGPYIVAGRIAAAFARDEWAASFMDAELESAGTSTAAADSIAGGERAATLALLGLLPIVRRGDDATLTSAAALARPWASPHPMGEVMARTLTTLPAVLGSSRIMHYLLMQFFAQAAQNGVAISDEPEARRDVERQLLRWLSSYWNRKDDRPHAPLHDLLVRINPVDDQPECWLMVAHLLPAWKGGGELPVSGRFAARVPALRRAQSQLEPGPTRASWLQRLLKRST